MVSLACLKICFRPTATVLFFFISRSPLHCALSASILGSVSHPVGDRPSHPICETGFSEGGPPPGNRKTRTKRDVRNAALICCVSSEMRLTTYGPLDSALVP